MVRVELSLQETALKDRIIINATVQAARRDPALYRVAPLRHENIEWLSWRTLCSKSPFPTLALSVVAAETIEVCTA